MSAVRELEAFLLSAEWRDTARGLELTLWGSSPTEGPVRATLTGQEAVMFVPRASETKAGRRVPRALRSRDGAPVDAVYFTSQRALVDERARLHTTGGLTLEADVKPSSRFLMERFIKGGFSLRGPAKSEPAVLHFHNPVVHAADVTPKLRALSLDLETDGWDGPVLSAALAGCGREHVFMVQNGELAPRGKDGVDQPGLSFHPDEGAALEALFFAIRDADPDALLGWNVVDFDLRVLDARCLALGLPFAIGRAGEKARVLLGETAQNVSIARVPGRVVLDGVATLKNASWAFERYTLEHVARTLLGRGKKRAEHVDALVEIRRMYRDDPAALAAYNLEDARLALEIFEKAELIEFTIARAKLTGLPLDRQGGSVAAFDYLYLPRLHRKGFVAPDVGTNAPAASPGGHVLDSVPGLFTHVASFDFRSLYPSIIRTFQIDPLGLWFPGPHPVTGFEGASFMRTGAILPEIISHLHEERTRAREAGNETLSRAIKILMNSFYGVLGTPGCRFFDPRLASSITLRGREIIERSQAYLEARGLQVIYGDTDSLFVKLDPALDEAAALAEGRRLAESLNTFWRERVEAEHGLESFLELRFDALFLEFLMPTMRGSEKGSKKRYAGTTRAKDGTTQLIIRGLEAIRTDWTPLAREAQRELLTRVFAHQPWDAWLLSLRERLMRGELDEQLVYRKRLRRGMNDYASVPPHVKAARLLESEDGDDTPASEVEYVMTTKGPEPLSLRTAPLSPRGASSPMDYAHYLDKQLAPAVDVVLHLLGTSFERIAGTQLSLF
ncbi:MAG: DNA polymerase II [Archangium sp.]|nr:DNA polymerase II [Archangium sp.]